MIRQELGEASDGVSTAVTLVDSGNPARLMEILLVDSADRPVLGDDPVVAGNGHDNVFADPQCVAVVCYEPAVARRGQAKVLIECPVGEVA